MLFVYDVRLLRNMGSRQLFHSNIPPNSIDNMNLTLVASTMCRVHYPFSATTNCQDQLSRYTCLQRDGLPGWESVVRALRGYSRVAAVGLWRHGGLVFTVDAHDQQSQWSCANASRLMSGLVAIDQTRLVPDNSNLHSPSQMPPKDAMLLKQHGLNDHTLRVGTPHFAQTKASNSRNTVRLSIQC
jgi:hypothetical protein